MFKCATLSNKFLIKVQGIIIIIKQTKTDQNLAPTTIIIVLITPKIKPRTSNGREMGI